MIAKLLSLLLVIIYFGSIAISSIQFNLVPEEDNILIVRSDLVRSVSVYIFLIFSWVLMYNWNVRGLNC